MVNDDVISMPDKWEYPWYAAWDLAFHTVALSFVDLDFAKQQLDLMLREIYLHPNGQIPAYEWNFGDVNPPVHAWATMFVYQMEKQRRGARRHEVPRARLSEAIAELHLVGQPEGSDRTKPVRRRISWSGQHRGLRPERPAADRRQPGTGGRDGVDGLVQPEHAADCARARAHRSDL